jgi:hypothetical protein
MIATDGVADKIRDLVDSGYFAEAKDLDYHLKSITEKISALINDRGGSVKLSIYDRQVMEMPVTVAEELPLIIAGYREVFGSLMAVGMGMDLKEASTAAKKATFTNQIELYDPKDESFALYKTLQLEADMFQPQPNLTGTDQENHPGPPKPDAYKFAVGKVVPALSADQQMQAEAQMVNATIQLLMGPTQQMQQQQQAQEQQQAEQEKEPPGSLLEAMSGEKKTDKPKTETKQKKDSDSDDSDESSESKKGKSDSDSGSDEDSDEDSDATNEKLGKLLSSVQEKMPELMKLHEKNPEAFKKVIALVQKLVDVAKAKKSVKKSEISDMTEDLNKALRLTFPVGTVRNRKKKVVVDGKAKWRGVAAGQVKDIKGNPISVDSHNAHAKDGREGKEAEPEGARE